MLIYRKRRPLILALFALYALSYMFLFEDGEALTWACGDKGCAIVDRQYFPTLRFTAPDHVLYAFQGFFLPLSLAHWAYLEALQS